MIKANKALVKKDYPTARTELINAAEVGNEKALYLLAVMDVQGLGGEVNMVNATALFFTASKYEYPDALKNASSIYKTLNKLERQEATKLADEYIKRYSNSAVYKKYYPVVNDKPIEKQALQRPAQLYKKGNFTLTEYEHKKRLLDKNMLATRFFYDVGQVTPGKVELLYDVSSYGEVTNIEVLFSWPERHHDLDYINYLNSSKFKPAIRNGKAVAQYGLLLKESINPGGPKIRKDYLYILQEMAQYRRKAHKSNDHKYVYYAFLRAYSEGYDDPELEAFEPVLKELAEDGYVKAQYDYGMYQLYEKRNWELGISWLNKAAKVGFAKAEYRLGNILYHSPSHYIEQDIEKAKFWLQRSSDQGFVDAKRKLRSIL